MWDNEMGWLTDDSNHILLRLDRPEDHVALRKDLLENPERILHPHGVNNSLRLAAKIIALSGSLTPAAWDDVLTSRFIRMGIPVFFLPHLEKHPLAIRDPLSMNVASSTFPKSPHHHHQIVAPIHLPPIEHFKPCQRLLRQRLHCLPPGYEFSVLRAVRELEFVCDKIARHAAAPGSSPEEIFAILKDLYAMAFRGIVISVAALAYHGLGFNPGCPPAEAVALLRHLRDQGPLSRRDLQRRFQSFTSIQRDQVLERLANEGLVVLDPKRVAAVPLQDFIQSIHARPEMGEPQYACPTIMKMAEYSEISGTLTLEELFQR